MGLGFMRVINLELMGQCGYKLPFWVKALEFLGMLFMHAPCPKAQAPLIR